MVPSQLPIATWQVKCIKIQYTIFASLVENQLELPPDIYIYTNIQSRRIGLNSVGASISK